MAPTKQRAQTEPEEELIVFGRAFDGTSTFSNYPIAGKLGEGTFGCVVLVALSLSLSLTRFR